MQKNTERMNERREKKKQIAQQSEQWLRVGNREKIEEKVCTQKARARVRELQSKRNGKQ